MATSQIVECSGCRPLEKKTTLFRALKQIADDPSQLCVCGGSRRLRLVFPFGLGATDNEGTVDAAFLPEDPESWRDPKDGSKVTFYPFLVVLRRTNRRHSVWMPYWHLVEPVEGRRKQKYGQWAPFMDDHLFSSLLSRARAAGYRFTC